MPETIEAKLARAKAEERARRTRNLAPVERKSSMRKMAWMQGMV